MLFVDRADAGRQLARRLLPLRGTDAVVVALPRGGVPVAAEVARELRAPLDVIVVRKLGVPFQPECGFGAIGEGGATVIDDRVVRQARLTRQAIAGAEARERVRLDRRLAQLRAGRPPVPLAGRIAVVVDDGIATGSTARAACLVARARGARRVIVAVPVGAAEATTSLRHDADEVICLHTPARFVAIGDWYQDFSQVADAEVAALLGQAATCPESGDAAPDPTEVTVDAGGVPLPGSLVIAPDADGLVVFVHGSGSSRHSPRNQFVAAGLNRAGLGTLLVDLLTPDENSAGPTCSTSRCSRPAWRPLPAGCAISPVPPPSRSVTSGPTPAPPRPWRPRPPPRGSRSPPSCPAVAARTWWAVGWPWSGYPPCSSWAPRTRWSST